jgi:exopolysaccharide biosynthesis protein
MVVEGEVVNRPSDGHERRITNAVVILPGSDPGEG